MFIDATAKTRVIDPIMITLTTKKYSYVADATTKVPMTAFERLNVQTREISNLNSIDGTQNTLLSLRFKLCQEFL